METKLTTGIAIFAGGALHTTLVMAAIRSSAIGTSRGVFGVGHPYVTTMNLRGHTAADVCREIVQFIIRLGTSGDMRS